MKKVPVKKFKNSNVLVVGDVMVDRYIMGDVSRISPEAPVPIVLQENEKLIPGGAANVAMNIASFGAHCMLMGAVGESYNRGELDSGDFEKILQTDSHGNVCFYPIICNDRSTTVKTRIMGRGQQLLRIDCESKRPISQERSKCLLGLFEKLMNFEEVDIVILSDYGKGVLTEEVCTNVISRCVSSKVPVIVDPTGTDWSKYKGSTVIKPNHHEFEMAGGFSLLEKDICDFMIVTHGPKGVSVHDIKNSRMQNHPSMAKEIFDVTGAGDTFAAFMAMSMVSGMSVDEAVIIGNAAAGVAVGKIGTSCVSVEELQSAIKSIL